MLLSVFKILWRTINPKGSHTFMDTTITMRFKVTPSQQESIALRASENGFDDIASYLKVVALKTQTFNAGSVNASTQNADLELDFKVSPLQQTKIEEKMKESGCEELTTYLLHVALHGVVTAVVEVRSSGDLDAMLERIAESRRPSKLKKLF